MTDSQKGLSSSSSISTENKIRLVTKKIENLFLRLQQTFDLIPNLSDPKILSNFKVRFTRLEITRREFSDLLDELNELQLQINPKNEPSYQQLSAFDDLYESIAEAYSSILKNTEQNESNSSIPSSINKTQASSSPPLPKISLKQFDGTLGDWSSFYNLFCSLVHNNGTLSNVQKLLYLQSCLVKEPLSLIKHLSVSDANYAVALKILTDRYESKRQLAVYHIDKLLNLPHIHTESYSKLRSFYELLSENYSALEALKIPHLAEFIIFQIAFLRLDDNTRYLFETKFNNKNKSSIDEETASKSHVTSSDNIPQFKDLLDFLCNHCKVLESSNLSILKSPKTRSNFSNKINFSTQSNIKQAHIATASRNSNNEQPSVHTHSRPTFQSTNTHRSHIKTYNNQGKFNYNCAVCSGSHSIYTCPKLSSLTPSQREQQLKSMNRCTNCMGNHLLSQCKSKNKCFSCGQLHHTFLCKNKTNSESHSLPSQSTISHSTSPNSNIQQEVSGLHSALLPTSSVLLGTAVVHIKDSLGHFIEARVLIDSGAQMSFLTSNFFSRLGLNKFRSNVSISGLGRTAISLPKGMAQICIKPRISENPILTTNVIIMERLTGKLPSTQLPEKLIELFQDLNLADPTFQTPSQIDGILGAELFPYIYNGQSRTAGTGNPSAMDSIFGWVITGAVNHTAEISIFSAEVSLEDSLKRFWVVEEPPQNTLTSLKNPDDIKSEKLFVSQHKRDKDGRYIVPLLLQPNSSQLGNSYNQAIKTLYSLERRLDKYPNLKIDYHTFMREYLELGHMKVANKNSSKAVYIPHHAVINPSSVTTKLRVVFNGSSKTDSGISLNDVLYTGPKLQLDIVSIIFQFRLPKIVFIADICKMFRAIRISPEETHFQRILWRFSPNEPVTEYELLTVTYGLRSSPYLANRTLRQLAIDEGEPYSRAAKIISHQTFVDDILSGADSVEEALEIQQEIITLMSLGGFKLRKWSSNHPILLEQVPSEDLQTPLIFNVEDDIKTKILGLQWSPHSDCFSYKIYSPTPQFTKRAILSEISKLYDPLGWISPVVFYAKHLIQRLWLIGVGWDDEIPDDLQNLWKQFLLQLPQLKQISIPRILKSDGSTHFTLLGFSDASEKGYAAVVYLHSYCEQSEISRTSIILAKSRVAPLQTLTIPRLELCGAALLAQLLDFARSILSPNITLCRTLAFSDSSTVLSWIRTPPHMLKTYVANRVVSILEKTNPSDWFHIPTKENPSDCASRGLLPQKLLNHPLWFNGPPWLKTPPHNWPLEVIADLPKQLPELRPQENIVTVATSNVSCSSLITQFSSFNRLQRMIAWCLRSIHNFRNPSAKIRFNKISLDGCLKLGELNNALYTLIGIEQKIHFKEEITRLQNNEECSSRLRALRPFLDSNNLIRVGGRIRHADILYDSKHPFLLEKTCYLSNLLIDYFHQTHLHIGPRALHSLIMRSYWIISARQRIRSRLSKCLQCFKMRPKTLQPLMGELPPSRMIQGRPFLNVGTDFGGPFLMKQSRIRNSKITKVYLCLFICFATKAVHLEVVSDLSTDAFLAAFDRFTSRRGLCTNLYSDCGTNYVGAKRYFSDLDRVLNQSSNKEYLVNKLSCKKITFHLNPPSAPHFGGLFEAGIKSAKHILRKVIGDKPLTFEEYCTLFSRIESMLNSRPLCSASSDPHELDALTPGHFLIGGPLAAPPEPNFTDVPSSRLNRWELIRQASQSFWKRWQNEYLVTLNQRHKWNKPQPNVHLDDLVLLNDSRMLPTCWKLGRIISLHPGSDGVVRVVTVRTSQGEFRRPVVKLAPLPRD